MRDRRHSRRLFRFGTFELDPEEGLLRRDGRRLKVQQKPLQLLAMLVDRPATLVNREELRRRLWPDTTVDFERGLNTAVNKLRVALRDDADNPRFIETVPRRGYRFIAPVEAVEVPSMRTPAGGGRPERAAAGSQRRQALMWVAIVVPIVAVAVLLTNWRQAEPSEPDRRLMLAVLPFEDVGGDPDQEYFSTGLTDEMILHLARVNPRRLGVIARTSVMRYKDMDWSVDQIAHALDVDYILEGSVQRWRDQLRIGAKLVRADDQSTLWADSYDLKVQDWFLLQRGVAEEVAQTLGLRIVPRDETEQPRIQPGAEAREAYLKGRYFRNQITVSGFNRALGFFNEAVSLEPDFADAYAGMASCHCLLSGHGMEVMPPVEAMEAAKRAALKALSLDESLAEAHAVLGMVKLKYDWDFPAAERSLRRALELDPNYAQAHLWHSMFLEAMGRQQDAVQASKRARDLDPLSLGANANFGSQLLQAGRVDRARRQFRATLELDPEFWVAHWGLGRCALRAGRYEEGIEHLKSAARLGADNPVASATLACAYAMAGRQNDAARILEELTKLARERYVSPAFFAHIHAALGDEEAAFDQLESAYRARSRHLAWLAVAPEYDSLRGDPRFQDLLQRIGLPAR